MTINKSSVPNTMLKLKSGASFVKIRPYFSYDSKHIMLASGNDIKVLSTASGESIRKLVGHPSAVIGIQTNPLNHTQAISCSRDGTIITWDYLDGVCLKKFKVKGNQDVVTFHAPSKSKRIFITQFERERNGHVLKSVYLKQSVLPPRFVMKDVLPSEHAVSFGLQGELVARINDQSLMVFDLTKGATNKHMSQSRFVCVACHPSEYTVATGDETGRILLWSNVFDRRQVCRSVYHWHTLPVADLCFSSEGFYLYSGGGECVLVKWSLQRENREFLPRLGMPICHIKAAPDNTFIAVSHVDNAVSLVSPQLKVVQFVQGLSQGHPWCCPGQQVASTGLLHDPRTGSLVLGGRPGHLQFYSLKLDKQLYSVDIVGQNFLTQERNKIIYNTQVEKAALSPYGLWLSTVQVFDDGKSSPDIALKVWKYSETLQTYSLNTSVILPHQQRVNCIRFRMSEAQESLLFVTTSQDRSFKTWVLQTTPEGDNSWSCESRGHYREQIPTEVSFKEDGSLLAVCFSWTVTLWTPSPLVLSSTLSHPSCSLSIRQICFGMNSCSHLLVSCSEDCLTVWNVSQQKPVWKAKLNITHLESDSRSEYMAAFSQDHTLFVFRPSSTEPCFVKENISESDIIAAAFIPHFGPEDKTKGSMEWQKQSQLYFLNKEQELLTVVEVGDENSAEDVQVDPADKEKGISLQVHAGTSFAALMAQHKSSGVKTTESSEVTTSRGLVGSRQLEELLEIPSHALPSLQSICSQFMSSLLLPKTVDVP